MNAAVSMAGRLRLVLLALPLLLGGCLACRDCPPSPITDGTYSTKGGKCAPFPDERLASEILLRMDDAAGYVYVEYEIWEGVQKTKVEERWRIRSRESEP